MNTTSEDTSINTTTSALLEHDEAAPFGITKELYEEVNFIINVIVIPIICLFGLIGNGLGVGILWKSTKQQKLTVYFYMCSLTACDALYLLFGLMRSMPYTILLYDASLAKYVIENMHRFTVTLDNVLSFTSTHLVIVMAAERLLALTMPFKVKDSILTKYPKRFILVIVIFNVIMFSPYLFTMEVASFINEENITEYYLRFRPSTEKDMDAYMFFLAILYNYIPGVILLTINISIPIAYSRIFKRRQEKLKLKSKQGQQQTKITVMVFCITFMYLMYALSDLFFKTLGYANSDYAMSGRHKIVFWFFVDISNLFMHINAANDFIIYVMVSDFYRQIFVQMYCKCVKSGQLSETSMSTSDTQVVSVSEIKVSTPMETSQNDISQP